MDAPKRWHKSTYSGNAGECVEVSEGLVTRMRDTQHREQGHLSIPPGEWLALMGAASR